MSRFSDAAYALMMKRKATTMSSDDLWKALRESDPDLTATTATRKTPRTTCMRDLRKDERFIVGKGRITLVTA